ncbi:MAG: DUF4271 domain-containing protein [Bacteroidales bacterium]
MAAQSISPVDSFRVNGFTLPMDTAIQQVDTAAVFRAPDSIILPKSEEISRFVTSHRQEEIRLVPREMNKPEPDLTVFAVLALAILIFSYIRVSKKSFFRNLEQAIFSRPIFKQLLRDGALFPAGSRFLVSLANLSIFGIFGYKLIRHYALNIPFIETTNPVALLWITGGILAFFTFKSIVVRFISFVFKTRSLTKQYNTNTFFFQTITAILLIPLLFFSGLNYGANLLVIALSLVLLLFIFRIIRALLISLDMQKYALYQIFLYLCALEILPILVIIKAIMIFQ